MMKTVLWILFIGLTVFMSFQGAAVKCSTPERYTIIDLQFANRGEGEAMLRSWRTIPYGSETILQTVEDNTRIDFLFILLYTLLLITCSNSQMQRERKKTLNSLLRLNLFLAFLIGILDVIENYMVLYNIRHVEDFKFISTSGISICKWVLAAWAILILLVSWVRTTFTQQKKEGYIR